MYSKQQKEKALNLYKETHSVSETVRILGYPTRRGCKIKCVSLEIVFSTYTLYFTPSAISTVKIAM